MARITVALLSTTPPGARGSMGAYGSLVQDVMSRHAPQFDLLPVGLCDAGAAPSTALGRKLARIKLIGVARRRASLVEADVYHVLDASFAYMIGGIPWDRTLMSVHDLIPALQARGKFDVPPPGWAARRLIERSLSCMRMAGAVQAVSSNTARDVLALTGREVDSVLLNPVRRFDESATGEPADNVQGLPYVLHVGNNSFYKNRVGVVAIFQELARARPDIELVLAGPAPDDTLRTAIGGSGVAGRVRLAVDPDDAGLARLYRQAGLLLFPSLYEGFGWPPLEAMRHGCPVVCSDAASLPEVVGDAALLCGPGDTAQMAGVCLRLLSDAPLRSALVERGYGNLRRFDDRVLAAGLAALYEKLGVPAR